MVDQKMMHKLRTIVVVINMVLMITTYLQLFAFNSLRTAILCSFVLMLNAAEFALNIALNIALNYKKGITARVCMYALWFIVLIMSMFQI